MTYKSMGVLREFLINELKNINDNRIVELNYDSKLLDDLLFDCKQDEKGLSKEFVLPIEILEKLDLSNVSFDNFKMDNADFSKLKGVKINPQTIYDKTMTDTIFSGVNFIGPFDGVYIMGCDFTNSVGAKINPQTIPNKDISDTNLCDTEIVGIFDDVSIFGVKFKGCKNVVINPQKVKNMDFTNTDLGDVLINGSFDGAIIDYTNFTGCKGALIDPQNLFDKKFTNSVAHGVEFVGSFYGVDVAGTNFDGSNKDEIDSFEKNFILNLKSNISNNLLKQKILEDSDSNYSQISDDIFGNDEDFTITIDEDDDDLSNPYHYIKK